MNLVATSRSLRVAPASEGQAASKLNTAEATASSCGRIRSANPRKRYVRKDSVLTF